MSTHDDLRAAVIEKYAGVPVDTVDTSVKDSQDDIRKAVIEQTINPKKEKPSSDALAIKEIIEKQSDSPLLMQVLEKKEKIKEATIDDVKDLRESCVQDIDEKLIKGILGL